MILNSRRRKLGVDTIYTAIEWWEIFDSDEPPSGLSLSRQDNPNSHPYLDPVGTDLAPVGD